MRACVRIQNLALFSPCGKFCQYVHFLRRPRAPEESHQG